MWAHVFTTNEIARGEMEAKHIISKGGLPYYKCQFCGKETRIWDRSEIEAIEHNRDAHYVLCPSVSD